MVSYGQHTCFCIMNDKLFETMANTAYLRRCKVLGKQHRPCRYDPVITLHSCRQLHAVIPFFQSHLSMTCFFLWIILDRLRVINNTRSLKDYVKLLCHYLYQIYRTPVVALAEKTRQVLEAFQYVLPSL